jgi:hypothetical protein
MLFGDGSSGPVKVLTGDNCSGCLPAGVGG